jgi:pimeloyl-ACP methyl ester carboxylesterase
MAATAGGAGALRWESTGEGIPVLLVHGLGLSGGAWWRTVNVLSHRMRVITFDNRGVGRSRGLVPAFTTEAMADDAVAVLDAAGVDRAHIYGLSLGGMVAQRLALRHPRRVRSLVLGATHAGGPRALPPEPEVIAFFRRRPQLGMEEAAWASVPYNYGPRCRTEHTARIAEDIRLRLEQPFSDVAYRAQMCAAMLHNCLGRLDRIDAPALIVHGRFDRIIPVGNAELMAEHLPTAQVRILEESGHLYPTEEPSVDEDIGRFFEAVA